MMIMKQLYQNRRYLISSHDVIVLNQLHEGVPSGKPTCKGAKETTVWDNFIYHNQKFNPYDNINSALDRYQETYSFTKTKNLTQLVFSYYQIPSKGIQSTSRPIRMKKMHVHVCYLHTTMTNAPMSTLGV